MRILVVVLALFGAALAQTATPPPPPSHAMFADENMFADAHVKAVDRQVTLTAEQKAKIRPMFISEMRELAKIMNDATISQADKQNKIQALHLKTRDSVAEAMTPAQRERWNNQPPAPRPGTVQN